MNSKISLIVIDVLRLFQLLICNVWNTIHTGIDIPMSYCDSPYIYLKPGFFTIKFGKHCSILFAPKLDFITTVAQGISEENDWCWQNLIVRSIITLNLKVPKRTVQIFTRRQ